MRVHCSPAPRHSLRLWHPYYRRRFGPFFIHLTGVGVPSVITTQPQSQAVWTGASVTFVTQPASETAIQGTNATFSGSATGTSAYGTTVSYQMLVQNLP